MINPITYINQDTEEFIRKEGWISCEFATTREAIKKARPYLRLANERLREAGIKAVWKSSRCHTCEEHHGPEYNIHLQIVHD